MEINRFIRVLTEIAENNKGDDIFIKINNSDGCIASPEKMDFEFYSDSNDRFLLIDGNK